jgi:LPS O-antigen subunit length determinant protein (WzzB/FepE family)
VRKLDANNPDNWKVINQQELLMIEAKAKAPPDKGVQAIKEHLQISTSGNIFKDTTAGHSGQRRSNKLTKGAEPNFQIMKDPCLSVVFISKSQPFRTPGGYSMKNNFLSTKYSAS